MRRTGRPWYLLALGSGLALSPLPSLAEDGVPDTRATDEAVIPPVTDADLAAQLDRTRSELDRQIGEISPWAKRVHPVVSAAMFLDAEGTNPSGRIVPGLPLSPLANAAGDQERHSGRIRLRLTGWQPEDEPGQLYAAAGSGWRVATLAPGAQDHRSLGAAVMLSGSGRAWRPVELDAWVATADLVADGEALWSHARTLYAANCAQCHAAPPPEDYDAATWSTQFDAMHDLTALQPDDAALVLTYLQRHAVGPRAAPEGTAPVLGELVYRQHCRACHGDTARDGSGGDIRGSTERTLRNAVSGYETMPQVLLTADEIAAVAAYLTALRVLD